MNDGSEHSVTLRPVHESDLGVRSISLRWPSRVAYDIEAVPSPSGVTHLTFTRKVAS